MLGDRSYFPLLLHEKFLQFDWLRAVVFQLNLKYLHVEITNCLQQIIQAWFIRDIWHKCHSWYIQIVSNFTRLTAREITYNNFEISLVVFMPNITTNHAITYNNRHSGKPGSSYLPGKSRQAYCSYCVLPKEKKRLSTSLYMEEGT